MKRTMQLLETSGLAKNYTKSLSVSKAAATANSEVERVNELQKTIRYLTNQNKATSILLGGSDIWQGHSNDLDNNSSKAKKRNELPVDTLVSKMNETLPNIETLKKNTIDSHYNSIVDLLNVATGNANGFSSSFTSMKKNLQNDSALLAFQPKSGKSSGYDLFVKFFTTYKESQSKEVNIQAVSQFLSSSSNFVTIDDYYKMVKTIKYLLNSKLIATENKNKLETEIVIYCYYMIFRKTSQKQLSLIDRDIFNSLVTFLFETRDGNLLFNSLHLHIKRLLFVLVKSFQPLKAAPDMGLETFFSKIKTLLDETTTTNKNSSFFKDGTAKTIVLMFQVFSEEAIELKNLLEPYIGNGEFNSNNRTQWTAFKAEANSVFSNEQRLFINVLCLINTIKRELLLQSTNKHEKELPHLVQIEGIMKTINKSSIQNKILNKTAANGDKFYYDIAKVLEALQPHIDIIHASTAFSPVKVNEIGHQVNSLKLQVAHTVKKHKVDFILGIV
ncbi:hypothetical protein ACO0RG_001356 [Hanseniaspora osmophila]